MRRDWRAKQKGREPKRIPRGTFGGRRKLAAFEGASRGHTFMQTGGWFAGAVCSRDTAQRRWGSDSALAPRFTFPADAQTKHLLRLDPQTYRLS